MRQLVIVVSDLYFAAGAALPAAGRARAATLDRSPDLGHLARWPDLDGTWGPDRRPDLGDPPHLARWRGLARLRGLARWRSRASLPGLARLARFGTLEELPQGWRSALAGWLGREDLAGASPGSIAACTLPRARRLSAAGALSAVTPPSSAEHPSADVAVSTTAGETETPRWVWLADPLYLIASLTSVHLSPAGLLRLDERDQAALCGAFDTTFAETGYSLVPSRCGRFLAMGPAPPGAIDTTDPARCLGSTIADALPRGRASGALRRLGGEIEMWLHEHPINVRRARSGQPPVSTLWLWGGGVPLSADHRAEVGGNRSPATALFGDDPYVEGLSSLVGATYCPTARSLASAATAAERAVVQIELFSPRERSSPSEQSSRTAERTDGPSGELPRGPLLEPRPSVGSPAPPLRAIEALDRDWIEPALELLARREIERLIVVANDRKISMMHRDRLKRWRRPRAALAALAATHPAAESSPRRARP